MYKYIPILSMFFLFAACTNSPSTEMKETGANLEAANYRQQIAPVSIEKLLQQKLSLPLAIASPIDTLLKAKYRFEQLPLWLQTSVYWPEDRTTDQGFNFERTKKGARGGIEPSFIGVIHNDKYTSLLFYYSAEVTNIAGKYDYKAYEIRNYDITTKTLIDSLPASKYMFFDDVILQENINSHLKINPDLSIVVYSKFDNYDAPTSEETGTAFIHSTYHDTVYYKMMDDGRFKKGR